jgi:hypothetical protein
MAFLMEDEKARSVPTVKNGKITYHVNIVIDSIMLPTPKSNLIGGGE